MKKNRKINKKNLFILFLILLLGSGVVFLSSFHFPKTIYSNNYANNEFSNTKVPITGFHSPGKTKHFEILEENSKTKEEYEEIKEFYVSNITGIINPTVSNYIKKCLDKANEERHGLIITMDTPGGLETSMREIVKNILNSNIPVIVFVYPEGARAASAGVFITYASDIAVMSPATSIGAAHPVNLGSQQQLSDEIMEKVVNDSVSFIKNLAQAKERNPEWAEKAVRESDSITSEEAIELKVIDYIAKDFQELFSKIDGLTIEKQGEIFLLNGKEAQTQTLGMGVLSKFLHIISDPNIAYILLTLGVLGIIYEFSQPGLGISGAVGTLLILLSFYSLSILPINYAGLGLIILAIILFVLDFFLGIGGILSIPAIISLVIGSFILVETGAPYLKIARGLIIGAAIVLGGFSTIVIRAIHKIRRKKPVTGIHGIIGESAVVLETLKPQGLVKIHGEIWKAISENGQKINKGEKVLVTSNKGLILFVKRIENEHQLH